MNVKSLCILFVCCFFLEGNAQTSFFSPPVSYIKGLQLFNPYTNDNTPIIRNDEYVLISFDDLNANYTRYYYTIIHCDRNWEASNLFESEYLSGYYYDEIRNVQPSFNTRQYYLHYNFTFPNDQLYPTISGNYKLVVYKDTKESPVFELPICIYEQGAFLGLQQEVINEGVDDTPNQRIVAIASSMNALPLDQNVNQSSLTLLQNNSFETALYNISPQFVTQSQLRFSQLQNVFRGGNEMYFFDTKNTTIEGMTTERIDETTDLINTYLYVIQPYPLNYVYAPDVDGSFYFRNSDRGIEREADTQADYSWVHFGVEMEEQDDIDLYVVGLFNQYRMDEHSQLEYNSELGIYEKAILLKQGYYNYTIAQRTIKTGNITYAGINGNFWQTNNLYQGLLYYRGFQDDYDRLIGYGEIRTGER